MSRRIVCAGMWLLLIQTLMFNRVNTVSALTNGYLGNGHFPTSNLNRCTLGTAYATEAANASGLWSAATDLNMFYNCTGAHIWTYYANYGNTNWAGYAWICNTTSDCDNAAAWGGTYANCTVRLSSVVISGNPGFYTSAEVQKLITHELGHCYSLDHATIAGSVMNNGSTPNWQDISLINQRY